MDVIIHSWRGNSRNLSWTMMGIPSDNNNEFVWGLTIDGELFILE